MDYYRINQLLLYLGFYAINESYIYVPILVLTCEPINQQSPQLRHTSANIIR